MTITLIGMPGSGKSCMGRALSRRLGMKTLDGDHLIEETTGRKLQDIINEDGLSAFKELEEKTLLSITEDNIIITPGGSAVYYDSVMKHFKTNGIIVYLYVSPEVLVERLGDFSRRGIVLKEGQTIKDLYLERAPLLEKYADITINCDGDSYTKYRCIAERKIRAKMKKQNQNAD